MRMHEAGAEAFGAIFKVLAAPALAPWVRLICSSADCGRTIIAAAITLAVALGGLVTATFAVTAAGAAALAVSARALRSRGACVSTAVRHGCNTGNCASACGALLQALSCAMQETSTMSMRMNAGATGINDMHFQHK
jgi:hypothetical protein